MGKNSGAIIVIGTALETNLAYQIVQKAIFSQKLVIEINPEPVLKKGNIRNICLKSDEALERLVKHMINLENQRNKEINPNTQEVMKEVIQKAEEK